MEIITLRVGFYATNCYIVAKDDTCLIIDPGANANKISNLIEENNLKPVAILLTHGHFDHIGAVDELVEKYKIDVYVHEVDKEMLKDKVTNCSLRNRAVIVKSSVKLGDIKMNIGNFKVDFIHSPGHTAGSCVILVDDVLFSGDVLFKDSIGRTDLPTASDKQMKESLKYLKQLPKNTKVYPGHGESTTIKDELETNMYLK